MTPGHETPWDPVEAAANAIVVDRGAAEVISALQRAGIRSILLKGASFDRWLYDSDAPRMYGDVDVLVAGDEIDAAGRVLTELGYRQRAEERAPKHVDHAKLWIRPDDQMHVDLHRSLVGVEGEGVDPWAVLSEDTERQAVGGVDVEVLSEAGRALQVALHATVHGPEEEKTLLDLSRALERASPVAWTNAATLARRLGAEGALAAGLQMLPEGRKVAERLELTAERSVATIMFTESVPASSWTFQRLATTPGFLPKLRIALRRVFPEPDFMRAWYPLARRGRLGLALSYPRRLAWMVTATGPAALAWWRARRRARHSG